ncbi:hypothetical protein MG293_017948 [Ovis ammon polii]|uniref:Uncharacterized protein n=1 Tax=Ovis ammon polii TaxID=230172 RepID=A0AAD4TS75_OVIAM|nr:hypothetical protein MG293_017948 [Ovis ammon polii]
MEGRSRRQKYTRGHGPAATEDGPAAGSSAAAWSRGSSASIPDHVPDLGIRTPGEAAPECSALARCLSGLVAGTTVRFTPLVMCPLLDCQGPGLGHLRRNSQKREWSSYTGYPTVNLKDATLSERSRMRKTAVHVPCVVHLFYPPTLYLGLDRDEDLQPPTCKRGLQGPGLVITVLV